MNGLGYTPCLSSSACSKTAVLEQIQDYCAHF